MVLGDQIRGKVEKIIDEVILGIPKNVDMARTISTAKEFQIKNPDDFALGIAWGVILRAISEYSLKKTYLHTNSLFDPRVRTGQ